MRGRLMYAGVLVRAGVALVPAFVGWLRFVSYFIPATCASCRLLVVGVWFWGAVG